ncbi:MAG: TRAP transporter small permease subunit [Thalassospira sp.]|uniref:TRAP transporter small permease n=1 Tax=Thalassospira sp. TaxID=1912094 RepID=UPI0032EE4648
MQFAAVLFRRSLEVFTMTLITLLALIVIVAVIFRYSGNSLVWYDEVASVMLAWITYYGAALAAVRRSHLSFSGVLLALPLTMRKIVFLIGEAIVIAMFAAMAWAGWFVLQIMGGETLISLPWVGLQFTQSVIPIGCALFVIGQLLSFPEAWHRMVTALDVETEDMNHEIAKATQGGAPINERAA